MNRKGLKGEKNPAWKGDKVSYIGIHAWIYKNFGKANDCVDCHGTSGGKRYEWANISGEYKRDISDWKMLCSMCHGKFDRKSEKMAAIRKNQETLKYLIKFYSGKRTSPTYKHEKRYRYKFS